MSALKYYSPISQLTGAYGNPVGYDCVPKTITLEFYDGTKLKYNFPFNLNEIEKEVRKIVKHIATKWIGIKRVHCDTGIIQEPSEDVWIMACANSRITKTDLVLQNGLGIIDPDYRGTIRFIYHSISPLYTTSEWLEMFVKSCGQLIAIPRIHNLQLIRVNSSDELTTTNRGTGGFGSSQNAKTEGSVPLPL